MIGDSVGRRIRPVLLAAWTATWISVLPPGLAKGDQPDTVPSRSGSHSTEPDVEQPQDRVASREPNRSLPELAEGLSGLPMVEQFSATLRQVVASVTPSVVHIEAEKPYREPEASDMPVTEAGAGIIVESRGRHYVFTNHHVVRESRNDEIRIFLADERVLQPEAIWSDMATDVAVLQLPDTSLPAARLGNSDQVQIGDLVLAFGSPFGLSHSVSHGIVSAKGRRNLDLGIDGVRIQDFLQTDAAINPGNSGGPLLNLRGEVIALNTAIASNSGGNDGIGFAIPINLVTQVASQLVVHGRVVRPYLGIRLDHEYDGKAHKTASRTMVGGARVSEVSAGSPAQVAGIQVGDIIVKIDGAKVEDDGHLVNLIGTRTVPGQSRLDVLRNGAIQTLSVELVERR